jgi:hypothetical protein
MACDMAAPQKPIALDAIADPETGLALLAKRPDEETPEQSRLRLFWQFQFLQWRDWRAGEVLAFARAMHCCSHFHQGPPRWLREAALELCERRMSDGDKRAYGDLINHLLRWEAVQLTRGRRPWDARNSKRKVRGDAVWEVAAKMLAGATSAETVRKSYTLIKHAGGERVTLPSYKRAVVERDRRRKENKLG